MSTLKKAYAFVKKYWGSDDDVLPSDLNRYEDGIDDLYSVTNKTNTNIGNLSNLLSQAKSNIVTAINEIVTNLQSEIETRGNTDTELESKINVLSSDLTNLQKLKAPNARGTSTKPSDYINTFKVTGLKTGAECGLDGKESFVHVFGINAWADTTAGVVEFLVGETGKLYKRYRKNNTEWEQPIELATTSKTDILVAPNTGYTITFNKSCKINNIAYINVRVKKTDGSEFISGAQVTPFTLPLTAGGETNGNGNGASGGFWRVPATVLFTGNTVVVNPTSNCTQIHITGVIVL